MNTHQHTPPQRSRYNMGYRTCPICDFQFTPESDDQTTCTLCQTAAVFRARAEGKRTDPGRKKKWHTSMVMCEICNAMFWPKTPAAKICHQDKCKREGRRRSEQRYLEKKAGRAA